MYLPSQIISENNTEYRIESVSKYKSRLIMYLESPRPVREIAILAGSGTCTLYEPVPYRPS